MQPIIQLPIIKCIKLNLYRICEIVYFIINMNPTISIIISLAFRHIRDMKKVLVKLPDFVIIVAKASESQYIIEYLSRLTIAVNITLIFAFY